MQQPAASAEATASAGSNKEVFNKKSDDLSSHSQCEGVVAVGDKASCKKVFATLTRPGRSVEPGKVDTVTDRHSQLTALTPTAQRKPNEVPKKSACLQARVAHQTVTAAHVSIDPCSASASAGAVLPPDA
mmetsp:Transcript_17538/g.40616  ORF Transcript_17538/g.40616 Transcript_17538/m.40616 type:complete len:130 (+) Transcript_17538:113-502(+)